jgi:hypothetical protein
MKQEIKNLDTKTQTLEHKISASLFANDATSDTLVALIAEVESAVSDATKKWNCRERSISRSAQTLRPPTG